VDGAHQSQGRVQGSMMMAFWKRGDHTRMTTCLKYLYKQDWRLEEGEGQGEGVVYY